MDVNLFCNWLYIYNTYLLCNNLCDWLYIKNTYLLCNNLCDWLYIYYTYLLCNNLGGLLAIGLKLKTNTFYVTIFVIGPLLLDLSLSTHAREIAHNHSWKQNTIEIKIIHFADTSFFQIK